MAAAALSSSSSSSSSPPPPSPKDGVRNFFFFLALGDLEGELSGDSASSIVPQLRTVISTLSTLVVSWLTRRLSSSSTSPWPSLPFIRPVWLSEGAGPTDTARYQQNRGNNRTHTHADLCIYRT
ncbi:hypothetical protein EYF80_032239 [Liparis tanakae]|uniref:Uncharacterized protein n=1 Tax=Liparis tanakae TaxID=230148 RepID=A0A4Z2GWP5_9TELE|nr:hypothetical protein EYF80_032239 [Liparis tanakae]